MLVSVAREVSDCRTPPTLSLKRSSLECWTAAARASLAPRSSLEGASVVTVSKF
jgi:hypothetical protein